MPGVPKLSFNSAIESPLKPATFNLAQGDTKPFPLALGTSARHCFRVAKVTWLLCADVDRWSVAQPSSKKGSARLRWQLERRGMFSGRLTMRLSGRTQARPARRERNIAKRARRERNIAKRARGAPTIALHGPLQPMVRPSYLM